MLRNFFYSWITFICIMLMCIWIFRKNGLFMWLRVMLYSVYFSIISNKINRFTFGWQTANEHFFVLIDTIFIRCWSIFPEKWRQLINPFTNMSKKGLKCYPFKCNRTHGIVRYHTYQCIHKKYSTTTTTTVQMSRNKFNWRHWLRLHRFYIHI